jgi:cell division protein FtsA
VRRQVGAIDIGSTKVAALVGVPDGNDVRIVGAGVVPSQGVDRGIVADLAAVTECVAEAVREVEKTSGCRVDRAFVSVGGPHVVSHNARGEAAVVHPLRGVEAEDVEKALAEARSIALPPERQVLHVVPRGYWLDGNVQVRDPIGMAAYRLEAEVHIVTALASTVRNVIRCVDEVGVEVAGLILSSLASGEAVLTESERDMGVALVDIGGGTTDIAVYLNGGVWHTAAIPTGGNHITSDLAVGLRCPIEVAEDVKLRFGHCRPSEVAPGERVRVPGFGRNGSSEIDRAAVVEIVEARVEEMFSMVLRELRRSSYDGLLSAGVALCGGTANLPGIAELAMEVTGMPVRVLAPQRVQGLIEVAGDVAQATGAGLLLWGMRQPEPVDALANVGFFGRVGRVLRGLLPG